MRQRKVWEEVGPEELTGTPKLYIARKTLTTGDLVDEEGEKLISIVLDEE